MKKIITIDGLASSGKSTLSRLLAKKLNWNWLSSGVLYRGFAYIGHKENLITDEDYLSFIDSDNWRVELTPKKSLFFYKNQDITEKIYGEKVDDLSSTLSVRLNLRKKLIPIQRDFYDVKKGLIVEGRDSGTVIFPEAPLKIFLIAPEKMRAQRRAKDRNEGEEFILKSQKERDKRDQNRPFAPVKQPENSLVLSSEQYSSEEMINKVCREYEKIFNV